MSGSLSHGASAEPNLTPILDMVFQLITFFMLVINFQANQIDANMTLPIVGTAAPIDKGNKSGMFVMVNLNSKGEFTEQSIPVSNQEMVNYITREAQSAKLQARRRDADYDPEKDDIPATVIIRADQATPFSRLNDVLKLCQDNGFRKFAFRAMNKKKDA